MSSLDSSEVAEQVEIERGQDREVTVTFKISAEALDVLVPKGTTKRQLDEAQATLLACGLYAMFQAKRDLQRTEKPQTVDAGNKPIIPGVRRAEDLRRAGRCFQVALTELEDALAWADKGNAFLR